MVSLVIKIIGKLKLVLPNNIRFWYLGVNVEDRSNVQHREPGADR